MKRLFLIVAVLLTFSFVNQAISAVDVFTKPRAYLNAVDGEFPLAAGLANGVAVYETATTVTYVWRTTFIDSSNNRHSPAFFIGGVNIVDGYIRCVSSAVGDVNVLLHYSADDAATWGAITTKATLDAVSATALFDTVGIEAGADEIEFHSSRWMVVELASGSSTNQDGNVYTTTLKFLKPAGTGVNENGIVNVMGRVKNTFRANP